MDLLRSAVLSVPSTYIHIHIIHRYILSEIKLVKTLVNSFQIIDQYDKGYKKHLRCSELGSRTIRFAVD